MTTTAQLDAPAANPLRSYPLNAHSLQSHETLHVCGGYHPSAWFRLWQILGWEDVNYARALRDSLFLLAPPGVPGPPSRWTPRATERERAFWWLATRGYLLDEQLPTREAVRDLVVQIAGARWHPDTLQDVLDDVDQLLAAMRKADSAST